MGGRFSEAKRNTMTALRGGDRRDGESDNSRGLVGRAFSLGETQHRASLRRGDRWDGEIAAAAGWPGGRVACRAMLGVSACLRALAARKHALRYGCRVWGAVSRTWGGAVLKTVAVLHTSVSKTWLWCAQNMCTITFLMLFFHVGSRWR